MTEGWSITNLNHWSVTANGDGTNDTLKGTSATNNAAINFRASTVVNKSLKFRFRIKPDADKTVPSGMVQWRDAAQNKLELELLSGGGVKVIAPGGATVLLDTDTTAPAFNALDGSFHSLILTYFSDTTNGVIKLEEDILGVVTTLGEKNATTEGGTYNSDPHATGSTLYNFQLRFKVAMSDDGETAGDVTP